MTSASQPDLIQEERGEYKTTPEQLAEIEAYRQRLKAFLEDPASRQIPGFPHAENEAILALSDPPYYTACPNPFLQEIIEKWEQDKPEEAGEVAYHRDPFAADVSEGKNDPIYNAHSYHTKVPHKAIMRYILHYTEPGDIVLDGFCGTGMTGVAAQLCGDKKTVQSLGYEVDKDGKIFQPEEKKQDTETGKKKKKKAPAEERQPFSRLGARRAALIDLSPAATFIAYNYNTPVNAQSFEREAKRILAEVEAECGWMYETLHSDGKTKGKINYTVWSDVFLCPACGKEMAFWEVAVDNEKGAVSDDWHCPGCNALLSKSAHKESRSQRADRAFETHYDRALGQTIKMAKQVPVLINYKVGKKRFEKQPDDNDLALITKIEGGEIPYPFPTDALPKGDKTSDPFNVGITHIHHFYTRRNLWVLAAFIERTKLYHDYAFLFLLSAINLHVNKMRRYQPVKPGGTPGLPGTLYVSAIPVELSLFDVLPRKIRDISANVTFVQSAQES